MWQNWGGEEPTFQVRALLNLILFILWPCPPWPRLYYERREWPSLVFDPTVYKLDGREVGAQWWGRARAGGAGMMSQEPGTPAAP